MEKFIYIIKSVDTFNGVTRVDNIYAESKEENAIRDVEKLQERLDKSNIGLIEGETIDYYYEKIHLFED